MASLFEPNVTQVTPVQDTKVFDALGNIYNFLSKQSQDNQQRKQEQQRINDSLNNLGGINASAASASGANYRAVQKALKGISKVQDRDSRIGARDRATQNALYGKIDKGVSNTNKSLDKLKDSLKTMFAGLTNFLKDALNKSLKQQSELAKMMRMQYLTGSQKDMIQKMANSASAEAEAMFGIKISKDDIGMYYKELIAGGKDLQAMTIKQRAAYAALRNANVEDEKAYTMAMSANQASIRKLTLSATDPVLRATMNNTLKDINDVEMSVIGVDKTIASTIRHSQAVQRELGQAGINSNKYISNEIKLTNGLFESVDTGLAAIRRHHTGDLGKDLRSDLQMDSVTRRGLAVSGNSSLAMAAADASRMQMISQGTGGKLGARVRSDAENLDAAGRNTKEGTLFYELSKAWGAFDNSLGGIFGQLSNRMDEIFGDSADVGKLVSGGFKIVSMLLSTIVFNTTGGALGILFRIGSAALAVSVIKKIIENKEKFKTFLSPVVDTLKSVLPSGVIETFKNIYNTLSNIFKVFVPLIETITRFTSGITDKLSEFFSPLVESLSGASGAINSVTSSINNGNDSIVDKIFGYLNNKLPEIGKFFGEVITPIASKLLNFLNGLAQQLWENTIKPLIPDLWNLLKDNWPLVLGAFAIKFLPDVLSTLLTSVLPKLLINVMPKLIGLLAAHPIALAIAAVMGGIAAGGMWLYDRQQERKDAEQAAKDAAMAEKKYIFATDDYKKAIQEWGPDDEKTQNLRDITNKVAAEAVKKRQEQRQKEAIAKLDDKEAKEAIYGIPKLIEEIKESDARRLSLEAALSNTTDETARKNIESQIKDEQERRDKARLTMMTLVTNAQDDTNRWGGTIEDIMNDSTVRGLSGKNLKDALEKYSVGDHYANTMKIISDSLASPEMKREFLDLVKSKNFGKGREEAMPTYMLQRRAGAVSQEELAVMQRNVKTKVARELVNAPDSDFDLNKKMLLGFGASNWKEAQIRDIATQLGIVDKLSGLSSADDMLNAIANNASSSDISLLSSTMKEISVTEEKKNDDDMKKLRDAVREAENSKKKIDKDSITEIAKQLHIRDLEAINLVLRSWGFDAVDELQPYARGGYVSKPTPALVGEDGAEVILPLTKHDDMKKAIDSLTDSQKKQLVDILSDGRSAYINQQSRDLVNEAAQKHTMFINSYKTSSAGKYAVGNYVVGNAYNQLAGTGALLMTPPNTMFRDMNNAQLKLLKEVIIDLYNSRDAKTMMDFIDMVISNNSALYDNICASVIGPYKKGDKHEIREIDMSKYPSGQAGTTYDNPAIAQQILDMCDNDMQKAHAFYDIMVPGVSRRAKAYQESMANQAITDGHDRIAGTPAEKALEAGASQLGKPYILQSLGNIGYVCNELTNYALKKSGADLGGFIVHQVATTFNNILKGKDGVGQLKIRDDLTPETAPPGMLFFQDSKNKDGTFSPGHVGLVYYGHKRLHSTGGASDFSKDRFLATWQSNKGVVIDDFPSDGKSQFKFGELPSLFVRADGTMADVSAYAGSSVAGSAGLSAAQWDVLDDIFGYRAGSVLDYTNRWLTKEFGADITAKQKRDNKSAEDLENYIDEKSLEEYEATHKDLAEKYSDLSLEQKFANYSKEDMLAKSEIYETQSKLLKEGMGAATPKIPAEERVARNAEISDIIDRRVKDKGDILSALTDIASILREVARSTKRPVPTVSKPQGTRFP